ncbi:MAG: glycosyltransferase [Planctomycetaceae bacterium]
MRIAFCITELDPGGAERALVQIVTRLNRADWEPKVFCLAGAGPLVETLTAADVPVVCIGARRPWNLSVLPRLTRQLRTWRPRLLQTFLFHANIVGRLAGRRAGVERIVSGIRVAERRSRWRLWLDRATGRWVDHHVCVSRGVAEFSIEQGGLPREKVSVIGNGVEVERFAQAVPADLSPFSIPAGSRTLLFIGRLDPQKDPLLLLEAFRRLPPGLDDVHLLLVGDGPLRSELMAFRREQNLTARVHFAGRREDVPALLRAAVGLVLPSRWEGLPNVLLEAMAAARPVVATRVEGSEELVRDGETGWLVPPNDPDALAEALQKLLGRPDQAAEMGDMAQDIARTSFTWDDIAAAYENLYRRILPSSPNRNPSRSA